MKSTIRCILLLSAGLCASGGRPFRKEEVLLPMGTRLARERLEGPLSNVRKTATTGFECPFNDHEYLSIRGGACNDSDPALFGKIAVNVIMETGAMLGVLVGTQRLAEKVPLFPMVAGLPLPQWIGLFIIIFASSLIGSLVEGGLSVASKQVLDPNAIPGDPQWYSKLKKPSWNPPGWLFPIMWLIVSKPTQMVAVSRILKKAASVASDGGRMPDLHLPILALYCAHLSLGDAWNKVFFGLQCIGRGVAIITAFFALLLASSYFFYQVDPSAGLYLFPTCGWVLVACTLNWSIYLKNKQK